MSPKRPGGVSASDGHQHSTSSTAQHVQHSAQHSQHSTAQHSTASTASTVYSSGVTVVVRCWLSVLVLTIFAADQSAPL